MTDIVQEGESVLREVAKEVPKSLFGTPELASMLKTMQEALARAPHGVAIAGPQVAIPYRIFLVAHNRIDPKRAHEAEEAGAVEIGVYINPKITKRSRKKTPMSEGCLSVHGMFGTTMRHERVTIEAYDEHGKKFSRGAGGVLAQAFQHEIDHLDGILFIDHAKGLHELDLEDPDDTN